MRGEINENIENGSNVILLSPAALAGNHWHVMLPGGNMRFEEK